MKKLLFLLLLVLIGYGGYLAYTNYQRTAKSPTPTRSTVKIGEVVYAVDVADTDNKRAQGLSGRESLPENEGMLFLFEQKNHYSFWMKGMLIPLDFVWIADNQIVDLTENVPAPLTQTYTPPFSPKMPVDKVLEINAGDIKKHGFQISQPVILTLLKPQSSP